jgi:AAA domain-containing protein
VTDLGPEDIEAIRADPRAIARLREYVDNDIVALPLTVDHMHQLVDATGVVITLIRKPSTMRIYTLAEVIAEQYKVRFLIDQVWTATGYGMLAGAEKTLKSYLALLKAISVASGEPLFGQFQVMSPGPVVLITGEGSRHLAQRRIVHLARGLYEMTDKKIAALDIRIIDEIEPVLSERFQRTYSKVLGGVPALVILDPFYGYHGGEAEAGNVYANAPILNSLSTQAQEAEVALLVVNHFNKMHEHTLALASITQAGSREWCNDWMLVKHRAPFDLATQSAKLELVIGSREGYGGDYDLDITLGPMSAELEHVGTPTLSIRGHVDTDDRIENEVLAYCAMFPWTKTKTELEQAITGQHKAILATIDRLEADGRTVTRPAERKDSRDRTIHVQVYGVPEAIDP